MEDGYYSFLAERKGARRVLGIDVSDPPDIVFRIRQELRSRVEFIKTSVQDLPKIQESF